MKICLVLPEYLPVPAVNGGAVETLVEDLIRYNEKYKKMEIDCITKYDRNAVKCFSEYSNTSFRVIRFCSNKYIDFLLKGINFFCRKIFKVNIRHRIRENIYNKAILKKQYDLIIYEGPNNYINKRLVEKVGKKKMVLHLHKVYEYNKEWDDCFENFMAISEFVKNEFCKNDNIKKERMYTVLNGIDIKKFNKRVSVKELEYLKNKYGIEKKEQIILYTGRLLPEKGVKELILAFKNMKNKDTCKLLIVGSAVSNDNKDTEYSTEIKELAKGENIIFTGYIANSELYKYYQLADLAVFPSIGQEGLGLVVLEALYSKLPTIITKSGGMPEITSRDTSFIVDLDENLINNLTKYMDCLIQDKELRRKMGQAGYELAKKYDSENYYKEYYGIVENLVTKKDKDIEE